MTFVGEGAVDHGGPKREFFRLFAKEASQTYLKGANENCRFFDNNVTAVQVKITTFVLRIIVSYIMLHVE